MRLSTYAGPLSNEVHFQAGLTLRADPSLGVSGNFRSPSGRLLELTTRTTGTGDWLALHCALHIEDLARGSWLGFFCRSAAPKPLMIRVGIRSGHPGGGFSDCFFDKHILSDPELRNHVDVIHLETTLSLPRTSPWRELVLFLPTQPKLRWDLHDLQPFLL